MSIKFREVIFSAKVYFVPLHRWDYACVCHELRTEEEGICSKLSEYQQSSCNAIDPHLVNEASKGVIFYQI